MGIGPANFSESPVKFGIHIWDWFSADGVCIYVIWLSPENYLGLRCFLLKQKTGKSVVKKWFLSKNEQRDRKKECHRSFCYWCFML